MSSQNQKAKENERRLKQQAKHEKRLARRQAAKATAYAGRGNFTKM